jgi:hypothetical protein
MEELVQYDPNLAVGILDGSAGTYERNLRFNRCARRGQAWVLAGMSPESLRS